MGPSSENQQPPVDDRPPQATACAIDFVCVASLVGLKEILERAHQLGLAVNNLRTVCTEGSIQVHAHLDGPLSWVHDFLGFLRQHRLVGCFELRPVAAACTRHAVAPVARGDTP